MGNTYQKKEYTESDSVKQAQQALQNQQALKPGAYQSQYQAGMDNLMDQIQNRPKFQYDVNSDALYQQVAQNYIRQGQQAMMDTMGQASALTGGYGNSYAQMAGQQAYQGYLQGLTELVPQYQQMAYQQYRAEGDDLLNRYNLMMQQEESDYGRYQDNVNQYYAELDRLQSAYDSERDYDYGRFADDRDFEYGQYMDQLNYQYQLERDKIADEQWQKEFDEDTRRYNQEWAAQQAAASGSSGGSGGGGRSTYNAVEDVIANGGYSSAEMLQIIRTSPLSKTDQDKLVAEYQKPKQKEEVNKNNSSRDNSAYWSR